jgi:asparagine synthase (glutamine-hydrolysing)
MCGIAGILEYQSATPDWDAALQRMLRALRHRGPDDEALYSSKPAETRCGFVHARLAILDLSLAGRQPMSTADGRFWITFNGEIYNFNELRQELLASGVQFKSHTDTEVILYLYERLGPRCVDRLDGMFAFAIWDAKEKSCFLARDPLAIKPLYYFQDRNRLLFASELRTLVHSGLVPRKICPEALLRFFTTGSVPEPLSLIDGIRLLPGGHTFLWQNGRGTEERYWRMNFRPLEENAQNGPALTRTALLDSVSRHFVSDVPVGLFLSGGQDSTALLALAQQLDHPKVKTFCISFDDPALNEGDIARRTAEYFGAEHFDWRLDSHTGASMFEDFLLKLDQPTIDGFNTFCVSKHAQTHGVKAVMSGLGGDELFGGYSSFRNVPLLYRWGKNLEPVTPLRTAASQFLQSNAWRPPMRRLGSYLNTTPTMRGAYETYRGIYTPAEAAQLVHYYTGKTIAPSGPLELADSYPVDPTQEDEVCRLEVENYMRSQLLRDSDVMSMAWGLELRTPFVDRKLVDTLTTIPSRQRLAPQKSLLLKAVPEIPEWVSRRPKQGFTFPFEGWLSAGWKPLFENLGSGSGVHVQTWYQKWGLFVLNRWCDSLQVPLREISS